MEKTRTLYLMSPGSGLHTNIHWEDTGAALEWDEEAFRWAGRALVAAAATVGLLAAAAVYTAARKIAT